MYRGIQFPDDTIESYTQGVFGMASCTITDSVDGYQMHITGLDRSKRCSRSVLVRPYTIAANTNTVTAIQNLVTLALGFTPVYLVTATSYVVNYTAYEIGTDPWEAVTSLAESIGYEVFFNCDGACVIQPQPDPSITPPSYTYAAGQIVVMDNIDRTLTNEESYNGVLTFGHSPYNVSPAFGEAWDTDPASPTYSGFNPATGTFVAPSRYGRVPKIMDSNPNIRTTAQAMAAASAELLRLLGTSEIIEFDAFVNPAHEESDVIGVVRTQAGINASYILDRFNIPLTIDSGMSARTRERRA